MVEANLKIIEELKFFLETVSYDPQVRKLISKGEDDFSRNRKLPFKKLIGILINLPKRSLSVEIQEFFDILNKEGEACTKGAFSLQRGKLCPLFFKVWNKWLVDNFYHYYGDNIKRWRSFKVLAVDGSTAYLLDKPEVIEHFGTHDNQHTSIPMARVMQIQDVLNDITVWGDIFPIKQSEQFLISRNLHHLAEDSLTLFDRYYPSYALMYLMMNEETPRHFVMRCRSNFNEEVKQFLRSSKRSKIIYLTPDNNAISILGECRYKVYKETAIKVRMVRITLPGGEQEVLLTNLYDEKLYSVEDLYYLYGLRWKIEGTYYKQKNQQQMEQFSGHRVICIEQDYGTGLFAANLQSLIEKQSETYLQEINRKRKYCYRINRNVSWASLKNNIVKLFLENDAQDILLNMQKRFERNIEPVRPDRKYERKIKRRRSKGKYQTFTNYKRAI